MTKRRLTKKAEVEYSLIVGTNEMVTSLQAAEMIGCTVNNISKAIQRGHLPGARKIDSRFRRSPYLIPLSEVKDYIAKHKRGQSKTD